jgi:hypothetical protein
LGTGEKLLQDIHCLGNISLLFTPRQRENIAVFAAISTTPFTQSSEAVKPLGCQGVLIL